ncbi:F-box/LRR-repeat protein At3g26922-like [Tripterygium wilfordii]|uniref:F-box/LRR-repeat protein At3g26922-like n=1 Tax=Tripterygium wilfordii TaxID=458696 RepID=UPI0018F82B98|nr:F-box/LRR-repeat protein At3g26922-like [Tripterygium wilfordii]
MPSFPFRFPGHKKLHSFFCLSTIELFFRMNAICMLSSPKGQKIDEVENVGENEDRISQLPDCILHCILSLLPTKDAVATCILSTRWKDLWISVTNLDLKCICNYGKGEEWRFKSFTHFVEKVLLLPSSNIKKFRLSLDDYLHCSCANPWILAAVRRQVQELRLSLYSEKKYMYKFLDPSSLPSQRRLLLPDCLYSCKTLRTLKVKVSCDLELPGTICLPNLTVLHLCRVNFKDDVSIHKLFSGLTVLEELELTRCTWNMITATISIPTLKSLALDFSFDSADNLYCHLRLNVENLMYFSYTGDLTFDLLLDNLSSLVDASIHVGGFLRNDKSSSHAANLFNGIRFAKSIKIDNDTMERLSDFAFMGEKIIPKFGYLTSLEVNATMTSETSDILKDFLQNSHILESLVVRKVHGGRWARDLTTQCPMLSLKTCSLQYFSGQAPEVSFLKFVLKRCAVLERIKLYCAKCLSSNPDKLVYISKQLEKALPKDSKSCVIEFL